MNATTLQDGLWTLKYLFGHPTNNSFKRKANAFRRYLSWYAHGIGRTPVEVPFVNGTRLLTKRKIGSREVAWTGLHEFAEMGFVAHCLRPDDVFVDIGANIGAYTVLAARVSGARCIAFEPVRDTFRFLQTNVLQAGLAARVDARQCAVGATEKTVRMTSTAGARNQIDGDDSLAKGEEVECVTLDSLLKEAIRPTVVKVDVEGYETEVLCGGTQVLASEDLLACIVETDGHGTAFGFDEAKIHQRLQDAGFVRCTYFPFERELRTLQSVQSDGTVPTGNHLYVRDVTRVCDRLRQAASFRLFDLEI